MSKVVIIMMHISSDLLLVAQLVCALVFLSVLSIATLKVVFASFLDFSKAFDKVSYWKLFHKLLDDKIDLAVVRLLVFWYSNQQACICWHDKVSAFFTLGNGTRQGGVLSPWFFARYVRDMLAQVARPRIGCNVGGMRINILAYADDIVLLAPLSDIKTVTGPPGQEDVISAEP